MDFSSLDNEQLLLLLKAAMAEATQRGLAMQQAATDAVIDAQEVARIKSEATAKAQAQAAENERQRILAEAAKQAEAQIKQQQQQAQSEKLALGWSKRKAIGVALEHWGLKEDWQINCWSRETDFRVYVEGGGNVNSYAWKLCLYVTGNSYHPPEDLDIENSARMDKQNPLTKQGQQQFKQFCSPSTNAGMD